MCHDGLWEDAGTAVGLGWLRAGQGRTSARRWHSGSERYWGAEEEETGARLQGWLWAMQKSKMVARALILCGWRMGGPEQSRVVGRGPI